MEAQIGDINQLLNMKCQTNEHSRQCLCPRMRSSYKVWVTMAAYQLQVADKLNSFEKQINLCMKEWL